MSGKVLTAIILPKFADNVVFKSYKITPRWQNAHAYLNAAFKIATENRHIKGRPTLVYGGINAATVHAVNTEKFLENKPISDSVLKDALGVLQVITLYVYRLFSELSTYLYSFFLTMLPLTNVIFL